LRFSNSINTLKVFSLTKYLGRGQVIRKFVHRMWMWDGI